VGAVAALGARHDEMITATLAIQDGLPEWLRVTALGHVAGGSACRRYAANAKGRECERCGPGAWREGARRGAGKVGISTAVWIAISRPTAFERGRVPSRWPPGRRMEGSSRVLGWAELLFGDCVSTSVSALFFTYGRKCKK
jgi:hypothetical protein